jgi:deoxyribodipyrimidine photo-lyase
MAKVNLFWFRRDLRIEDNKGLYLALTAGLPVVPVFIFDRNILDGLDERSDRRVSFIHKAVTQLQNQLQQQGSTMDIRYGRPGEEFRGLIAEYEVHTVFTNHDYEPYALARDLEIEKLLLSKGIGFHTSKDQVIFEKKEVVKDNGEPYGVFTPYSKKWKSLYQQIPEKSYNTSKLLSKFYRQPMKPVPTLESMGFVATGNIFSKPSIDEVLIRDYDKTRDIPMLNGTTRLGVHLRFGTICARKIVAVGASLNETFLNELIWREFFMQFLWHHPRLVTECYRKEYEQIKWRNNEDDFDRWCKGKTGYPLVDAGMRELNETGFMHNRVRMVTASFLVKHLLVDWRWGEAYFASKLLDYELASNNGNWQWAAGCGCDAAPYFRIFNPYEQAKKFDAESIYVKKWIPEFNTDSYPAPIVDHAMARDRCLKVYKKALSLRG